MSNNELWWAMLGMGVLAELVDINDRLAGPKLSWWRLGTYLRIAALCAWGHALWTS